MSVYSLIKPPRGSNVSGGEILKSLLNTENMQTPKKKTTLIFRLLVNDEIFQQDEAFVDNREAFAYLCGYIAKCFKTKICSDCKESLFGSGTEDFCSIITQKSKGYLTYALQELYTFLTHVEAVITNVFEKELEKNAVSTIIDTLNDQTFNHLVGCVTHKEEVTQLILAKIFHCTFESRLQEKSQ